ncbi:hypothetical protein ABPG74_016465 [Tetrahymena malaccensis]
MGSEKSKPTANKNRFSEAEQKSLTQLFISYSKQQDISKAHIDNAESLQNFLSFKPDLRQQFYKWLVIIQNKLNTSKGEKKVTFQAFASVIEYMTKSKQSYMFEEFNKKKYTSLEILCLIMFFVDEWDMISFNKAIFTREKCSQIMSYILFIFGVESDKVINAFLDQVFKYEENQNEITADHFFYKTQSTLQYINRVLIDYWSNYVYNGIKQISCPELSQPSEIISNDFLPILYSHNSSVQHAKGLYLLYSSSKSGISFNRLAFAILGYNAPTLILIKHKEVNKETNESQTHIIGAYHQEQWYSQLSNLHFSIKKLKIFFKNIEYQGDSQTYLFSLYPTYRTFNSYEGQGSTNYAYLNNRQIERSKYKVGLGKIQINLRVILGKQQAILQQLFFTKLQGFGGNEEFNSFRFWVDDDIQANSYVKSEDKTFGSGCIVSNGRQQTKLDVQCLEIWGIGSEENLQAQFEYRENERREIEKMRKVDKKAMWDNGFNKEMFFGKLNAHQAQLKEEIKREDEENKEK